MAATLAFFAWQRWAPVAAAEGWQVASWRNDTPMVSGLARDKAGTFYATLEYGRKEGSLVVLEANASLRPILGGLDKPDGLIAWRGGLLASQEGGLYPLLHLRGDQREGLFEGTNIEGIAADGQFIYAVEDLKATGRLLRFDPATKTLTALRTGLAEAEGVAVCPDGSLFYSEKGKNRVMRHRPGDGPDAVLIDGLRAPGFLACDSDGLWVAEDATHRARILLIEPGGKTTVVLSRLRAAQSVLNIAPGRWLVAEQGRGRILELRRNEHASR